MLRHVGKKGNTTVYEWRTGLQPLRVERPEVEEVPEQPKEDTVCPGQPGPSCGAGQSPSRLCRASVRVRLLVSGGLLLSFSPQIDWGDFTLEPTRGDDGAAAHGGAPSDEIDWGITLEPIPQVRDPWLCALGVWPCSRAGAGDLGVPWPPPPLSHGAPFLLQQDDSIDWGDGESEEVQITVLEAGTEGEHGWEGMQGVPTGGRQCPPCLYPPSPARGDPEHPGWA